jgi:hypothetical protein
VSQVLFNNQAFNKQQNIGKIANFVTCKKYTSQETQWVPMTHNESQRRKRVVKKSEMSNLRFHENPYIGSRTEEWADRTKQIVTIRNLENARKNICAILQLAIWNFTKTASIKICNSRSVIAKNLMTVKHVSQVSFPNRKYFRGLFNDAVSNLGYVESNGTMIHEWYWKVH